MDSERLLPIAEVCRRVGFKRSWLYKRIERGEFPKPIKIGKRAIRWKQSSIDRWINSQPTG